MQPLMYACESCYRKCNAAEHPNDFGGIMHPLCFVQWAPRTCPLCRTKLHFRDEDDVVTEAVLAASVAEVNDATRIGILSPEEYARDIAIAIAQSLAGAGAGAGAGTGAGAAPTPRRCRTCAGRPLLRGHSCPNRKRKATRQAQAQAQGQEEEEEEEEDNLALYGPLLVQ